MKTAIDNITTAIVRPPRARYSKVDLGPTRIRNRGQEYNREDFEVFNDRGIVIRGSLWLLSHPNKEQAERCIVYLHPNSGCRVDVVRTRVISIAAQARVNVCGFDFSGCGDSGGEFVSLGVHEKEDLCSVLAHLLTRGCKRFFLWGRSMGAATAAMFYGAYRDLASQLVVGMVLDSPFTSFQVNPLAAAPMCRCPVIVLSGDADKIVSPHLSEELYHALGGAKIRILFEGGHNSQRPTEVYEAVRELCIASFQRRPVSEILSKATAVLLSRGHGANATTMRRGDVDDTPLSARVAPTDFTAESEAYQLAADAEQALRNLLKSHGGNMEKLTEEEVAAALAEASSGSGKSAVSGRDVEGTGTSSDVKKVTCDTAFFEYSKDSGGKDDGTSDGKHERDLDVKPQSKADELAALKSYVRSTHASRANNDNELDAKRRGESKTMRTNGSAAAKNDHPAGSEERSYLPSLRGHKSGGIGVGVGSRTTAGTQSMRASAASSTTAGSGGGGSKHKIVVVRSFTYDPGPQPDVPHAMGSTTNAFTELFTSHRKHATTKYQASLTQSVHEDEHTSRSAGIGAISPLPERQPSSHSSMFSRSLQTQSSSVSAVSSPTHSNSATTPKSVTKSAANWFSSLIFSNSSQSMTAEDKADKEMCPRIPSSWAQLCTSMAVAAALEIVSDQVLDILIRIAVGLHERAPGERLEDLSSEHRTFMLSVLATTAMADIGISSASHDDTLSYAKILEDASPRLSSQYLMTSEGNAIREISKVGNPSKKGLTPRSGLQTTGSSELQTHLEKKGNDSDSESDIPAPTEEKVLADPSEEGELAPPSEESSLAPDPDRRSHIGLGW